MDAETVPDAVEEAKATELDRLGSQQALVALTDAELEAERVLRAAARSERTARETFAAWADDEAAADAREAFESLAEREREHYERVVAELDEEPDFGDEIDPLHEHLRELDGTVARAAGLIGRSLAADRTQLQVVNYFVNEADERRADLFRELRAETAESVDVGTDLLVARCEGESDAERARGVAERTVQVAYDDYAETLDGMGLDPKPIC
ncbi:rubrerythrin family protein [Halobacteriales archaeon QS_1_67_19]|nr:MAG: rubrerythrin family protein [Halobacteriales archaeon QS_1_67_19]